MLRTLFILSLLVVAMVFLAGRTGRLAARTRIIVAILLPLGTAALCIFPPDYAIVLFARHDGNIHILRPLSQVRADVFLIFVSNADEWAHFNWDPPWLLVDGYCGVCGKPYAPPGTFVVARLPNGFAYTRREPGEYDHMTAPTYIPRWSVLAVALPFTIIPSLAFWLPPARRYRRLKQGLCVNCGYNLTGNVSGTCLECGLYFADGQQKQSPDAPNSGR